MRINRLTTLLVSTLAAVFVCAPAFADRDGGTRQGGNSSVSNQTKLKARLVGVTQVGAYGEAKLETKTTKQEFSAEVKLPLPSLSLNLADAAAASAASITVVLARGTDVYATCDLDLKVENSRRAAARSEFKVEMASYRGAAPVGRYGNCVDNSGAVVVPSVLLGDTIEVSIDTLDGPFLTGVFSSSR